MIRAEIEAVLDLARTWSHEKQERVAEALLELEIDEGGVYSLSDEERLDIRAGVAEANRGEFAADGRVQAMLSRRV